MKVTALNPINHNGKLYAPGESFDVDGADLDQLVVVGAVESPSIKKARAQQEAATAKALEDAAAADEKARADAAAAAAAAEANRT